MQIRFVSTLYHAGLAWSNDNASYLGAALAYYALFSIAPLLLIGIAIVGLVFGPEAVEQRMVMQLAEYVGPESARMIEGLIDKAWPAKSSLLASIVGPVILVVAAANFFRQLRIALFIIWELPLESSTHFIITTILSYLIGVIMVLLTGLYWLALMAGDVALSFFITEVGSALPGGEVQWHFGQFALLLLLISLLFLFTFRFMSHRRIAYRHLWFGSIVGAGLFMLGRLLFSLYVRLMGDQLTTAFGAASSLVIFLVWVYYSAQILLYAAEVVKVSRKDALATPYAVPPPASTPRSVPLR